MGARSHMQFVEKHSGDRSQHNTKQSDGKPRTATPEKTSSSRNPLCKPWATEVRPERRFPDSIELELFSSAAMKGSGGTSDPKTFVEWCDNQIRPSNSHDGRAPKVCNGTALDRP